MKVPNIPAPSIREQVAELWVSGGLCKSDIARRLGTSRQRVYQMIGDLPRSWEDEARAQGRSEKAIRALVVEGLIKQPDSWVPVNEIREDKFGVGEDTVRGMAKKGLIELSPKGRLVRSTDLKTAVQGLLERPCANSACSNQIGSTQLQLKYCPSCKAGYKRIQYRWVMSEDQRVKHRAKCAEDRRRQPERAKRRSQRGQLVRYLTEHGTPRDLARQMAKERVPYSWVKKE